MKVIRDVQSGTWTLVPVESAEEQVLDSIIAAIKPGDKLGYNGRSDDGEEYGESYCKVRLHAGGHQEDVKKGNVTYRGVWVGGIDFVLQGSGRENKLEVGSIRDTCFFGSGGLIYLGSFEVDGKRAIVITASHCKICGGTMVGMVSCEWAVCDNCAAKCTHQWIHGAVHGGGAGDIGFGEYCGLCGRGKPKVGDEPEKSQLEHHLEVERELGIQIIYKDTGLTPRMVAYLQKLASEEAN